MNYEIIERGRKAEALRGNNDFTELMNEIKSDLFKQFTATNVADVEARENLHKLSYSITLIEKRLEKYVEQATFEINLNNRVTELQETQKSE